MPIRAILHVPGEEAIRCELEEMPKPSDNFIIVTNPRRKDGKPIPTMDENATTIVFPWTRVSYIEFFEETSARENVVGLFRESDARRTR
ncbi:MAG TPA: hypothetical protein VMM78_09395 [Thermomicrobiales bacterium]|nr:hypothetical protein [Thermomicrobiales bacterium]